MRYIYIISISLIISNDLNDSLIFYFDQKDYLTVVEIANNAIDENNKLTDGLYKKASE